MTDTEAGEKVKQARLNRLEAWWTQLAQDGSPPLACVIWDAYLLLKEEVVVEDVIRG